MISIINVSITAQDRSTHDIDLAVACRLNDRGHRELKSLIIRILIYNHQHSDSIVKIRSDRDMAFRFFINCDQYHFRVSVELLRFEK